MARRGENIRKRKDGRWEGRYQVLDIYTEKTYSKSVYAKTYGEVKSKLSAIKGGRVLFSVQADGKKDIPCTGLHTTTFDKAAGEWLFEVGKGKKYATLVKYSNIYNLYIKPVLGNIPVSEITSKTINGVFPRDTEKSASTLKSISCVTNQIMKYASAKYNVPLCSAVCDKCKSPRKPVEVLSKSEQIKLMKYLYEDSDIYKVGIILCLSTGLRLGEICSLKWEDLDFENKFLHVNRTVQRITAPKGSGKTALIESEPKSCFSKREIPVTDTLIELLLPYKKEGGYVLNGKRPMEPRTYQNKFAGYLAAAGIRKTNFHTLRHTFATNCMDSGADVKSLSEIMGHSDVRITLNRYVHPTAETKRRYMDTLSVIYGQYVGQKCV